MGWKSAVDTGNLKVLSNDNVSGIRLISGGPWTDPVLKQMLEKNFSPILDRG